MIAYVCLVFIFFVSYVFFRTHYDREKTIKYMITTFFVCYLFLLCLRSTNVGIDTNNYISSYFNQFKHMQIQEIIKYKYDEIGFSILVKFLTLITSNGQLFIAVIALISVIPIMILYRRESKEAALCCSIFMISLLFEFFFSGLRQGIAIGLTVPAYYFTKQKKIIPFLITVLFAVTFHLSAFMIIFIYPVFHAKITGKWLWIVVPAMGVVFYNNRVIFSVLFEVFGGKYFEKYSSLLGTTNQTGLLTLFILLSAYSVVMLDPEKASEDDIGLRNILLLATVIQCFAPLHDIASRMNYYYILFIPIAITHVNHNCKTLFGQIAKVASFVMTIFFIFYFFFMKGDTLQIMEYNFCF